MIVEQTIMKITTEPPIKAHGNSLRGYIAHQFPQYDILHNHMKNGKFLYLYPRIQYRTINGEAYIIGLEEGIQVVREIEPQLETIQLKGNTHRVIQKQITFQEVRFGFAGLSIEYSFIKPWLALNEKNHSDYIQLKTKIKRDAFWKNILIGNILSISKSLGYIVEQQIRVDSLKLKEHKTSLKSTPMLGFLGTFLVNFEIPDYWGIGKSVSRGFGTVKRVEGKEEVS